MVKFPISNFQFPISKAAIFVAIFLFHLFFRFYDLENRTPFGWDQVDNAWAAKDIIVDHKIQLVGMQAKQNSGFYIGPFYYYFIAPFYWFFDLDPIASGVVAGVTSIFTFCVLFYIAKRLFSTEVALMAVFLHTISFHIIDYDRIQWPVNLITPVSLIIFYFLYQVVSGKVKYLLALSVAIGISFHLNFTSIFFPIIVLLTLPLIPRTKETVWYGLLSIPLFLLWLIPNFLYELQSKAAALQSLANYITTYYHGIHLRRIVQLAGDTFIEVSTLLMFKQLEIIKFLIFPLFCLVHTWKMYARERLTLCYLLGLWFVVPWIVFSLYSGEITNYYFTMTRPIVLVIASYLLISLFRIPHILPRLALSGFLIYYAIVNVNKFLEPKYRPLSYYRREVLKGIKEGRKIEFQQGIPQSYIYYFYTTKRDVTKLKIE